MVKPTSIYESPLMYVGGKSQAMRGKWGKIMTVCDAVMIMSATAI